MVVRYKDNSKAHNNAQSKVCEPQLSFTEEDWHMPIESSQYFIILFRVNQALTFYHFIVNLNLSFSTHTHDRCSSIH